jgi:hypothetical protein
VPNDHSKTTPSETATSGAVLAYINEQKLLTFQTPPNATSEQKALAADIMSLDHRAHEQLGPDTPDWKEVLGMLENAANYGLVYNEVPTGRLYYDRAEQAFFRHIEAKNRVKYLVGLMLGVAACTLLSGLLYLIAQHLAQPFITPKLLPLLCLFAGMGSLTSVLTRLNQLDLKFESSSQLIMVSGAARPVVAIFFALVVYLIIDLKLVDIKFGSPTDQNQNSIYFISSFLCGFSERFAQEILSKVVPGIGS